MHYALNYLPNLKIPVILLRMIGIFYVGVLIYRIFFTHLNSLYGI